MSNFWKGVASVLAIQWLFGIKRDGRWGCSGCLTYLILGICLITYLLGILE
ncbi:MAG: hypothetical protein K2N28_00015 [Muribaculaceae bacterium]|nr:hypothetical protein [Muribaculaceae bacterium]